MESAMTSKFSNTRTCLDCRFCELHPEKYPCNDCVRAGRTYEARDHWAGKTTKSKSAPKGRPEAKED